MFSTAGHDPRPRLAHGEHSRKPGASFGRGAGSRFICTISGSTCGIRRDGRWLLRHAAKVLSRRVELGDRRMDYRGINGMYVHLYRWGELKRDLRHAGFRIDEVIPLDEVSAAPIPMPWLVPSIRAGGWIVFAKGRLRSLIFQKDSSERLATTDG